MDHQIYNILERYYRNECSPDEVHILLSHFHTGSEEELMKLIMKGFELEKKEFSHDSTDQETLDAVYLKLEEQIRTSESHALPRQRRLWPRIAAVAAAVALIVLGVYFFNAPSPIVNHNSEIVNQNDIAPGKNGATITLANRKVINLSDTKTGVVIGDDKLVYNDNTVISSAARDLLNNTEDMTASTTKGQTYIFTLPDGTKVWLNAASTLTIPSDFSGTESRKVELTGEAYFEVSKNKKRPFIVESNGQQVEVLGTHFNINTFEQLHMGAGARTTLLEGSVKVTADGKSMVLQPGKMAYNSPDGLRVLEADVEQAVAWKNGYFSFKDESIQNIMLIISRWYDIEVSYQGNVTKDGFNGKISRFKNISQVLKMLEDTKLVHFKVEGRRVIVKE